MWASKTDTPLTVIESEDRVVWPYAREYEQDGVPVPEAPSDVFATGLDRGFLCDLILKMAHRVPRCTTQWVATQLHLPIPVTEDLLMGMRKDNQVEVLGREGLLNHRYAVTGCGHERAMRLLETSSYVGPAPVTLESYTAMLDVQIHQFPDATYADVQAALADLVLPPEDVTIAAAATLSQRSLFLFGPAGNGKTSIARSLHNALKGELWIPYCVSVGSDVIQLFDSHVHHESNFTVTEPWKADGRWVRIQRPLVVTGGEMTIDSLELQTGTGVGVYEFPLHVKANGGVFVIDDFGRQRVDAWSLLNRWVIPMEHGFDYLVLNNGRKVTVPYQQLMIVATNIDPEKVMDPACLRRMGYRVCVSAPTPEKYVEIFENYARHCRVNVPPGLIDRLLEKYADEGRELRACEPRDLIGRVRDICLLYKQELILSEEFLDIAWCGYFGTKLKTV